MEARQLERLQRRLDSRLPLLGGWLRRRALRALAADSSPDTTRALLDAWRRSTDDAWGDCLLAAIRAFELSSCRDVVASAWAESRSPALLDLLTVWGHVAQGPPAVRVLTALQLGRAEVINGLDLVAPLLTACVDVDADLAAAARACLLRLTEPAMLAEVASHWAETRDDLLLQVLTRAGLLPSFPITARVLLALKWDHLDIALEHGAAVVALLLGACTDRDSEIASRAAQALRRLRDEAAREALCRQALEEGNAAAVAAAREIGCAPVAPERRAMFYFLSDQWAAYEALDFDRALLRAGYETATPGLRRRVLDRARQSGRVDVAEALLGGAAGLRPERMSADEWRALLDTLERTEGIPKPFTEETWNQTLARLREQLEHPST